MGGGVVIACSLVLIACNHGLSCIIKSGDHTPNHSQSTGASREIAHRTLNLSSRAVKKSTRSNEPNAYGSKKKPRSTWNPRVFQLPICSVRSRRNLEVDNSTQDGSSELKVQWSRWGTKLRQRARRFPPRETQPRGNTNHNLESHLQILEISRMGSHWP